jgi:hypothetical protein
MLAFENVTDTIQGLGINMHGVPAAGAASNCSVHQRLVLGHGACNVSARMPTYMPRYISAAYTQ